MAENHKQQLKSFLENIAAPNGGKLVETLGSSKRDALEALLGGFFPKYQVNPLVLKILDNISVSIDDCDAISTQDEIDKIINKVESFTTPSPILKNKPT